MKTMKAAEIVLDFDLYPRNNVDPQNVRNIAEAVAAGIEMPPVIIDRKSKRCIDGFHRTKEVLRRDPDGTIAVIEKNYANESAMFLDAMKYNAQHGCRLDPCDRVRCAIISERLQIPLDAVAGALNMTVDKLATLHNDRTGKTRSGEPLALKQTISKGWHGRKLNKRQEEANEKLSGMNQSFYANQLIELIESGLLDKEDDKLFERLKLLHTLLDDVLAAA